MNKETQNMIITNIINNILSVPGVAEIHKNETHNKITSNKELKDKYCIVIDEKEYCFNIKIDIICFLNTNILAIGKETQLRTKYIVEEILKRSTNIKVDVCIKDLVE